MWGFFVTFVDIQENCAVLNPHSDSYWYCKVKSKLFYIELFIIKHAAYVGGALLLTRLVNRNQELASLFKHEVIALPKHPFICRQLSLCQSQLTLGNDFQPGFDVLASGMQWKEFWGYHSPWLNTNSLKTFFARSLDENLFLKFARNLVKKVKNSSVFLKNKTKQNTPPKTTCIFPVYFKFKI